MNTRNFNHGIIICAIVLVGLPSLCATFIRSRNTVLSHSKDSSNSTSSNLPTNRRLETRDFVPLACNANVNKVLCTSWLSKFGDNTVHFKRIVIECGECITMDYKEANMNSSKLTLLGGLDIQGKLVFPVEYTPSHSLTVRSTLIVVQGQLDMYATSKAVDGNPQFTFIMISDNRDTYFSPIEENVNACDTSDSQCMAGVKGIIIAGGKLNGKEKFVVEKYF